MTKTKYSINKIAMMEEENYTAWLKPRKFTARENTESIREGKYSRQ
jgi:hypothetical protein